MCERDRKIGKERERERESLCDCSLTRANCDPMGYQYPATLQQHPATPCNTLQHTASHCHSPQCFPLYQYQYPAMLQQHTATTHCDTLRDTAGRFNTLQPTQHTTTHRNTLQHSATLCNTLQHTATHLSASRCIGTLQYTATRCDALQLAVIHCILQHTAIHCNKL